MPRFGQSAFGCVCLLAAAACTAAPQPPMRVAADSWVGNEALAVAERAHLYDTTTIRRVEFSSNQEVLRALRNGVVESAALMLDEAMVAVHDGVDLVIVAAVDCSFGSDVVIGRPPARTMRDLKGRRVGVQLNSASLQLLYRGLAQSGMSIADVAVISAPPDRHLAMYISGDLDAVVTFDPMRTQLMRHGAVDLFNSTSLPGDVVNVLVVRRDYLSRFPERGRALVGAWFAGADQFRLSAEARAWAAHRAALSPDEIDSALGTFELYDHARSRQLLAGVAAPLLATAHRFHYFMRQNGRLTRDIWVEHMFQPPPGWTP